MVRFLKMHLKSPWALTRCKLNKDQEINVTMHQEVNMLFFNIYMSKKSNLGDFPRV